MKLDKPAGPRIGGAPPIGLASQYRDGQVQYFGTFPLLAQPGFEFSVFHRMDKWGTDPVRDIIEHNNRLLTPSQLIWVAIHATLARGTQSQNAFEARALTIGADTDDLVSEDGGCFVPNPESKLGGSCFVRRHELRDLVHQLEESGYNHLLQIGEHGNDFIADFPWDPGYLNVWASEPLDPDAYRFCIQQ